MHKAVCQSQDATHASDPKAQDPEDLKADISILHCHARVDTHGPRENLARGAGLPMDLPSAAVASSGSTALT